MNPFIESASHYCPAGKYQALPLSAHRAPFVSPCTIITGELNEFVQEIYTWMPVILGVWHIEYEFLTRYLHLLNATPKIPFWFRGQGGGNAGFERGPAGGVA